jgi:hypothetical protein
MRNLLRNALEEVKQNRAKLTRAVITITSRGLFDHPGIACLPPSLIIKSRGWLADLQWRSDQMSIVAGRVAVFKDTF